MLRRPRTHWTAWFCLSLARLNDYDVSQKMNAIEKAVCEQMPCHLFVGAPMPTTDYFPRLSSFLCPILANSLPRFTSNSSDTLRRPPLPPRALSRGFNLLKMDDFTPPVATPNRRGKMGECQTRKEAMVTTSHKNKILGILVASKVRLRSSKQAGHLFSFPLLSPKHLNYVQACGYTI